MNKKVILVVAILLLILVGAGGYFFMGQQNSASKKDETAMTAPTSAPVPTVAKARSMRDLLTAGISQKCTFTLPEAAAGEGTIYVNAGKMRGDITMNIAGKTQVTHMLVMDQTSYVWMGEDTTGFKMTFDSASVTPEAGKTATKSNFNPDQTADYNCTPWVSDSTTFTLPKAVKFSDFSAMMAPKTSPAASATGSGVNPSDNCGACNYLSGESKTQCLTAMNCPQ